MPRPRRPGAHRPACGAPMSPRARRAAFVHRSPHLCAFHELIELKRSAVSGQMSMATRQEQSIATGDACQAGQRASTPAPHPFEQGLRPRPSPHRAGDICEMHMHTPGAHILILPHSMCSRANVACAKPVF